MQCFIHFCEADVPNFYCHNFHDWGCRNLSFGLTTKAKGLQGCGPRESPGVTSHAPKVTPNLGDGVPVDSRIFRERFRGQNSMSCGVFYIIEKLLERRCLKWALIAHLDIWNTSYGQKKGRESNWQFDSRPLKVGNRPDFRVCKWHATCCWKAFDKGYNFASNLISIRGLHAKLWRPKVAGVLIQKTIWMWAPWRGAEYTIKGKVVASPKSGPWWVLCVRVTRGWS